MRSVAAAILGLWLAAAKPCGADEAIAILLGTVDGSQASGGDRAMQGFERELAEGLCAKMQTECSFATVDRARAVDELLAGKADIALAALVHEPGLEATVALTLPYAMPRHGFAVASAGALSELPGTGKTPSFAVTPQMAEAAIAALRSPFKDRALGATAGSADLDFLERHFGDSATLRPYPNTDAAVAALLEGEIAAVMAPVTDLAASGQRPGFQAVRRSGPEFGEDELLGRGYAAALQLSDTALRDRVNRALDRLILDGSLRKLSLRWFALDVTPQRCGCKPF